MNRATHLLALCVAALLLCACKGIGRELVTKTGRGRSLGYNCDAMLATCELPTPVRTMSQLAPKELSLPPCTLSGEGPLRSKLNLRDCVLDIEEIDPVVRELRHSTLFRVRVELHGEATLSFLDSTLNAVAVASDASETGRQGSLDVSHSELTSVDLRVGHLSLLSSALHASELEADELIGTDIEVVSSKLSAGDALLSSTLILFSAIPRCDALLLAGSNLRDVRIAGCSGVTRVYESALTRVQFDGSIEADRSSFAGGVFGLESETVLTSYRTSVNSVIFCSQFQRLRMSTGSLSCSDCEGPLTEDDADVCTEQYYTTAIDEGNLCDALMVLTECETFPRRTRPLNEI